MKTSPASIHGFTLTELLVVLAIGGILLTIAIPNFKSLAQGQRVKNASFEVYAAMIFARSEAIKKRGDVTVSSANVNGWVVTDSTGTIIENQPELKGIDLNPTPSGSPWVTYRPSGRIAGGSAPVFAIDAAGETTVHKRCVKIELSGMPRIYKPSGGSC